jgi:hypothetical protein
MNLKKNKNKKIIVKAEWRKRKENFLLLLKNKKIKEK